ncbi:UDP-galactose translocator-like isoform X1 [Amphibalanus amphitrite]|uniref:UDP-galactose translocator-like isoform X1 n=1 Tax=Amphibalanus amphitrite TaxID=1232801 RepID=UPI001C925BA6|nr:UDP-galactose translocator-like isoform X1 [Amphibalanus amphitrite]XP_043228907.1 UDP-galactose translocator-like isoform X1 [Amphibalanus amphitrite]XP_043228908.1 UDP-galactose translocator-like isoform X1 [Amphibalanus amphitrite]XP_043228909.1 UDP-galactose translocator-like isoform X1 [Amphibalanus amphitrite]XP_043228910.1 UDP-galactose translocator-like isoform X1 [Amphibalanus amphitrite]
MRKEDIQAPTMFPLSDSSMKYVSLVTLTVQNALLGLCTRYVRTRPGDMFLSTSAVLMGELVKLFTCIAILIVTERSLDRAWYAIKTQILQNKIDTLKVGVPSLIYTIQNNLLYIAASNLDAATYQVTYQLKILTTAIFAVTLLRRSLRPLQWVALLVLLVGVALVQLAQSVPGGAEAAAAAGQSPLLGFCAALAACFLSGFAGIYFEKILKGSNVSVWIRNVQLSSLSLPLALLTGLLTDGEVIAAKGLLFGFDAWVWFVVMQNAMGGLLVAVVVKYADNILKGFATSLAIIISCIVSIYLFDFQLTAQFALGTALVLLAVFMYSYQPKEAAAPLTTVSSKMA